MTVIHIIHTWCLYSCFWVALRHRGDRVSHADACLWHFGCCQHKVLITTRCVSAYYLCYQHINRQNVENAHTGGGRWGVESEKATGLVLYLYEKRFKTREF